MTLTHALESLGFHTAPAGGNEVHVITGDGEILMTDHPLRIRLWLAAEGLFGELLGVTA